MEVKEKTKKKETWIKKRHYIVTELLRPFMAPYVWLRYGIRVEKFKEQGKRPYLVLLNHQTPFDQFFVGLAFRGPVYYMATEDIFSMGWVSSLIRWLIAPIPIKKQTTDVAAVMNCMRVAREGGTICIAPEGNRTYDGRTVYMNPAIAGLARKLKLPIALFRLEGGYGVQPRWSDGIRRGKMQGYVSQVIEPEEAAALGNDGLMEKIRQGLFVDENVADGTYKSKKRAEYLERVIYVCPRCGLTRFESQGIHTGCCKCGMTVTYNEDKTIEGVDCEFPFRFVGEWYDYQQAFVNGLDLTAMTVEPLFHDRADITKVILNQRKEPFRQMCAMTLYGDRVVLDEGTDREMVLPFAEVEAISVLGRNKLNIYYGKDVFQFKGSPHFNALKYVNFYHRHKNIVRGNADGQFLGL